MNDVYVIGVATTPFKRWPETTHRTLTQWALDGVQKDAGVELSRADGVWFGNCALHVFGQATSRGQVLLSEAMRAGQLEASTPVVNVEAGCATGSLAFHGAAQAIAAGQARVTLAVGVEKTFLPHALQKIDRVTFGIMSPTDYASAMQRDPRFPRSVAFCLGEVESAIDDLISMDAIAANPAPLVLARTARDMVDAAARKPWGGLEVGDLIERLLARCTSIDVALAESCFLASYERTPIGQHAQASRQAQN